MKEETKSLALKYAAGYLGQKAQLLLESTTGIEDTLEPLGFNDLLLGGQKNCVGFTLRLRSIEGLTDEEAKQLCSVLHPTITREEDCIEIGRMQADKMMRSSIHVNLCFDKTLFAYQYLKSIGIALPYYHNGRTYSVQELESLQIIKLI